jgi:hypothetical protein
MSDNAKSADDSGIAQNDQPETVGDLDPERTVWHSTGRTRSIIIHLTPDCRHLDQANSIVDNKAGERTGDESLCMLCTGDPAYKAGSKSSDKTINQALVDADPEDLGLSSTGDRAEQDERLVTDGGQLPYACDQCGYTDDLSGFDEVPVDANTSIYECPVCEQTHTEADLDQLDDTVSTDADPIRLRIHRQGEDARIVELEPGEEIVSAGPIMISRADDPEPEIDHYTDLEEWLSDTTLLVDEAATITDDRDRPDVDIDQEIVTERKTSLPDDDIETDGGTWTYAVGAARRAEDGGRSQ